MPARRVPPAPPRRRGRLVAGDGGGVLGVLRVLDPRSEATTTRGGGGECRGGQGRGGGGGARGGRRRARRRIRLGGIPRGAEEAIAETLWRGTSLRRRRRLRGFGGGGSLGSASASRLPRFPSSTAPPLALSPLLVERLGWGAVSPAVIAAQLLELGELHPRVSPDSALARALAGALPAAYASLASASDPSDAACARDGGATLDAVATILDGARWLWTGAGLPRPATSRSTRPRTSRRIFTASPRSSRVAARSWTRSACATRSSRWILSKPRTASRRIRTRPGPRIRTRKVPVRVPSPGEEGSRPIGSRSRRRWRSVARPRERGDATTSVGRVFPPGPTRVMAPARELARNDAEWLLGEDDEDEEGEDGEKKRAERGTRRRSAAGKEDQAPPPPPAWALCGWCTPASHAAAERLGLLPRWARWTRARRPLACPDPRTSASSSPCTMTRCFSSGTSSSRRRRGRVERSRHPGLRDVRRAFAPRAEARRVPGPRGGVRGAASGWRRRACARASAAPVSGPSGTSGSATDRLVRAPRGRRAGARRTVGGGCVFDPAGVALVSNASGGGGEGGGSNDRRTSGAREELRTPAGNCAPGSRTSSRRVAAGLRTLDGVGVESAESAESTFIRLPLRTRAQAERASASSARGGRRRRAEARVEARRGGDRALLFSSGVRRARCVVANASGGSSAELLVDVRRDAMRSLSKAEVQSPGGGATSTTPWNAVHDKEWRRSTLTSFFGGGGTSTRVARSVVLTERAGGDAADSDSDSGNSGNSGAAATTTSDEWIVGAPSASGARTRVDRPTRARVGSFGADGAHARRDGDPVDPAAPPCAGGEPTRRRARRVRRPARRTPRGSRSRFAGSSAPGRG